MFLMYKLKYKLCDVLFPPAIKFYAKAYKSSRFENEISYFVWNQILKN